MSRKRGGAVILTGTVSTNKGSPGTSVYSASKAALRTSIRCWAAELAPRKIRVNLLSPGSIVDTGAFPAVRDEAAESFKAMLRSVAWDSAQRNRLGCTVSRSAQYEWASSSEYEAGELTLQVRLASGDEDALIGKTGTIALHVDDVESSRHVLEQRGVEFDGDTIDSGKCLMARFKDPSGNALMLHHRYARGAGRKQGA